jgi:hypothetical protein
MIIGVANIQVKYHLEGLVQNHKPERKHNTGEILTDNISNANKKPKARLGVSFFHSWHPL